MLLPITHTVEVFSFRRVSCINYPAKFQARVRPGPPINLSLQDGYYVVVDLADLRVVDDTTGKMDECLFGWRKDILDSWVPLSDESRVVIKPATASGS